MPDLRRARYLILFTGLILVALLIACGEEATPTATPTGTPQPTSTPTATPVPSPTAVGGVEPHGTLDVGMEELGPLVAVVQNQGFFQGWFELVTTHENPWRYDAAGVRQPFLVKRQEIDSSGLVHTLHLQEGAKWHDTFGDWGEFTADDFIFTMESTALADSARSAASAIRSEFFCDGCELTKIDEYTVELKRPTPTFSLPWFLTSPQATSIGMHSKKHFEAVGEEIANTQSVGTGPWRMVEFQTDVFRKMKAVRDHWRLTPEWDEMIWWDIRDESTRLANFETGSLDIARLSADSVQAIRGKNDPNIKYMTVAGAEQYLNIHGQQYYADHEAHVPGADGEVIYPLGDNAYDCTLPWVSCNPDVNSEEWDKARKVRLAMNMAIDRQKLVNNLVFGQGEPMYIDFWKGPAGEAKKKQFGLDTLKYEYNPERARQLLAEADHPDGFSIDILLVEGQGQVEGAEAVATMWEDVGINARIRTITYSVREQNQRDRTLKGIANDDWGSIIEPLYAYQIFYRPTSASAGGFEHPVFEFMAEEAFQIQDETARYSKLAEMAKWIFDNAMMVPLYREDVIWPLGPDADVWEVAGAGTLNWLSDWDAVPHR